MANIRLDWSASPPEFQVIEYVVYHNRPGATDFSIGGTPQTFMIVYPDQLGYEPGDSIELHVKAVNATGEQSSNHVTVRIPLPLPCPPPITDLVATLV